MEYGGFVMDCKFYGGVLLWIVRVGGEEML